nr:transposase (putative), gypsy type [Tanacetum cinerariifolium]
MAAAKVSPFEILCRVQGFKPTVRIFVDSSKNRNDRFFWVDAFVFPIVVPWHENKSLKKNPSPLPTEYNADVCDYLTANLARFKKFSEPFLCLIGISRYYTLNEGCYPTFWDDEDQGGCSLFFFVVTDLFLLCAEMDLFAFIRHADPTKVKVGDREAHDGEVPMLELTMYRVVPLAGVYDHKNSNVQDAGNDDVNEGVNDVVKAGQAKQGLLERSTLAAEVGVTPASIVPFVTSSVTPTPEHEGGGAEILRLGPSNVPGLLRKVNPSIFRDYASPTAVEEDVVVPSSLLGLTFERASFIFLKPWMLKLLGSVGVARQACFSAKVRMRLEQELRGRQKLKEIEAVEAICLRDQIAAIEAAEATRITKLNILKERNVSLEGQVATLEFAVVSKDAEIASSQPQISKLTHDLFGLQLSCDVLSVKASPLEFEKDKLVSGLEVTCSGLCEEVMRYKLFKEWVEEMQDEKMKILSRGLRLMLANCLESPGYLFAMGEDIGRAIDKGMQDGLTAGIEHGRVGRGIADVVLFNPFVEGDYVAAINALRDVNFPLLDQLEANKDSSMVDIMDLLRLEGPVAETSEASQLQPSPKQLMWGHNRSPPVSIRNLTGEASSFMVLAIAVITALSTMFSQTDPVPLVLSTEVPLSPKIIFEEEELDTKLEHVLAPEDHGTSGDDGSSVTRKSLGLLERSTLAVEVGVTAAAILPFVTSSVTPIPEHEGGGAKILRPGPSSVPGLLRKVNPSIFRDYASPTTVEEDVVIPSSLLGLTFERASFIFLKPWMLKLLGSVGVARQACFSAKVRMRLEQELRGRQKLEERYAHQEVEAAEAICLRDQIAAIEAAEVTGITKLNILKERDVSLEGKVATLEFAVVSGLEVTCSGLRDEAMRYKLFKERVEEMQDEKMKVSDRVAAIDSDLMEMVLHMDAKFYPCYLTTIAGRKWILSRGLRLMLANCLASPEYLFSMGEDIGRAIDKGMQDGLTAGIEHGRIGRGIADVVAFNPFVEGDYVAAINALRDVNFPLLDQLEANKDSSMVDIMDLLRLEGPVAETSEASQLQPSPEQLMGRNHSPPVSIRNLTGEASSFAVLAIAVITALSTMFSQTDPVPLVLSTEVPSSPKIIFEEEELDTKLEHVLAL